MRTPEQSVLRELMEDGLITMGEDGVRTTRRWQSAMMRAIARHLRKGDDAEDIRYVIADALIELHGNEAPEDVLCAEVEAMTFVELELMPQAGP
ncbi:MAG: hypothetical protein ACXWUG_16450 [Polyangiales bacterium]